MKVKIKNGSRWGKWTFDDTTFTLVLNGEGEGDYEIDLESITDSAAMLDWIIQLRIKTWATNDIIGDLLSAFEDIFQPQDTLCGGGHNKTIDPSKYLKELLKN
jgi:hypothetical protein